jgi:hypothetical protein
VTIGAHIPTPALVELAHAWHQLAQAQRDLDTAAAVACEQVAVAPFELEDPVNIAVTMQDEPDVIVLNVHLGDAPPESLRAWATPNLVLLRARTTAGTIIERLVRLPAAIEPSAVEIERDGSRFEISLERRSALPAPLWPPVE